MDMQTLNYDDFSPLFGAWAEKFRPFIEGPEMFKIYQKIKEDAKTEIICPDSDNVFRVFQTSNPADVKSVWYMMDPYAKRYKNKAKQATGIAMSCDNSPDGKLQPSLEKFYEGMALDLGKEIEPCISLQYLSEQGILMLNTDLTCKLNKTGSHSGLWEPFHEFFLQEVLYSYTGIVYVLSGNASHKMEKHINPLGNYIYKIEHPVAASYKNTEWNCQGVFKKINNIVKENNAEEIFWNVKEWEEYASAPF